MILKKSIIAILANFLFFSTPVAFAYAQTTATSSPTSHVIMYPLKGTGSTSAALRSNQTANLQTRAAAEITRRITVLNLLLKNITNIKHLSADSRANFTTQIQNEIANLTALQTKIQGDTDLVTLKTDVQSIVTSYRVFALFMPQLRLLSAADSILVISDNLTNLGIKLQGRLVAANTAGQNVSALQAPYSDMQAKIKDAQTQANAIIAEVTPLTPEGFPGNKTTLQDARAKLSRGILDLKTAATDARQIIQGLMAMGGTGTTTASGSSVMHTGTTYPSSNSAVQTSH